MPSSPDHRRPIVLASVMLAGFVLARPSLAAGQDLTPVAVAAARAVDQTAIDTPRIAGPTKAPTFALPARRQVSFVMQSLYVWTATAQGLDAHSTFRALDAGAVESNSIVQPFASHRPAFIALKAGMAAAFIYAGHDLSTRHKIGAIVALGLVNSVYTAIALHNYRIVHQADTAR